MQENQIKWRYTFDQGFSEKDRKELYETQYDGKPVRVEIICGERYGNLESDVIKLLLFEEKDKKGYTGITSHPEIPHQMLFIESNEEGVGQRPMASYKQPNLVEFVRKYAPLIKSHRELKKRLDHLLP